MADKGEETTPHANEWEVLSLTASAYAAAPGPVQVELDNDDATNMAEANEAKTSEAMLMSGHFAFPQREHEKIHLESESTDVSRIKESKDMISDADDGGVSKKKDDENWNEIQFYSEKDNISFDEVKFKGNTTLEELNFVEKELSLYKNDPPVHVEEIVGHEQVESTEGGSDSDISKLSISAEEDESNGSGYPYEAWWKKHAAALYAQAKETNAFWSIFVAATVMGLVIIGQRWQLERWQILQLRWQFSINSDKMGWMLSPLSRFKDVILGGNRRGFVPRNNSLTDH